MTEINGNISAIQPPAKPMNQTLLIFAVVAFIGIVTPGPTVLLALTNGSRYGLRASLPGMLGAVLSDFVLISAVAVGWARCWRRRSSGSPSSSGWAWPIWPGWACAC